MEQAIIAGSVAILLWALSRVPGFTAAGRIAALVQRDLMIVERLPRGEAKARLVASVERRVLQMLVLRGEGTVTERASRTDGTVGLLPRWISLGLSVATVGAGIFTFPLAVDALRAMPTDPDPQSDDTLLLTLFFAAAIVVTVSAGVSLGQAAMERRRRNIESAARVAAARAARKANKSPETGDS